MCNVTGHTLQVLASVLLYQLLYLKLKKYSVNNMVDFPIPVADHLLANHRVYFSYVYTVDAQCNFNLRYLAK